MKLCETPEDQKLGNQQLPRRRIQRAWEGSWGHRKDPGGMRRIQGHWKNPGGTEGCRWHGKDPGGTGRIQAAREGFRGHGKDKRPWEGFRENERKGYPCQEVPCLCCDCALRLCGKPKFKKDETVCLVGDILKQQSIQIVNQTLLVMFYQIFNKSCGQSGSGVEAERKDLEKCEVWLVLEH